MASANKGENSEVTERVGPKQAAASRTVTKQYSVCVCGCNSHEITRLCVESQTLPHIFQQQNDTFLPQTKDL